MAFGLELLSTAATTVCVLSERRMNRLMNPALNAGLPAFLTKGAGMMSGLMLTQYTAGALICENRILCQPAAIGSIPAAADQEDFVSMGMTTAIKGRRILDNAFSVLAIEFMAAAQALDFLEPLNPAPATRAAYEVIRGAVEYLDDDRPLYDDINNLTAQVRDGAIVKAAEEAAGTLDMSPLAVTAQR
jgi:histidine ammonia-lyase